jgi:hypothetical protein
MLLNTYRSFLSLFIVILFSLNAFSNENIEFDINDKKQQCEIIGFKPETEKFADCVLRLVELDVKKKTQSQIVIAESSGNQRVSQSIKTSK